MIGNYKIYKYTNIHNGKVYIGQTKLSLSERAQSRGNNYKECSRFYNAIKKYGWDSFRGEVIADGLSKEAANKEEMRYISLHRSTDPAFGYNILNGGCQHEMNNETKLLISEKAKMRYQDPTKNPMFGKKHSEETKQKMSEIKLGRLNPMYGKTWSETQRKVCGTKGKYLRLSDARRAEMSAWATELGHSNAKKVICVEDNCVFNSVTEAARYYAVNPATLCGQLRGRQKTCRGKHFEYVS